MGNLTRYERDFKMAGEVVNLVRGNQEESEKNSVNAHIVLPPPVDYRKGN